MFCYHSYMFWGLIMPSSFFPHATRTWKSSVKVVRVTFWLEWYHSYMFWGLIMSSSFFPHATRTCKSSVKVVRVTLWLESNKVLINFNISFTTFYSKLIQFNLSWYCSEIQINISEDNKKHIRRIMNSINAYWNYTQNKKSSDCNFYWHLQYNVIMIH